MKNTNKTRAVATNEVTIVHKDIGVDVDADEDEATATIIAVHNTLRTLTPAALICASLKTRWTALNNTVNKSWAAMESAFVWITIWVFVGVAAAVDADM